MLKIFSPKKMLAGTGRKLTTLSYILYALSMIGCIVGSIVLIWFIYDWEGGEALIAAPFILVGGVLAGLLMGLMSAMPLKGFAVIVEYFENAQSGAAQASSTAAPVASAAPTAPAAPVAPAAPAAPVAAPVAPAAPAAPVAAPVAPAAPAAPVAAPAAPAAPIAPIAPAAPAATSMNTWKCTCGRSNSISISTCPRCGTLSPAAPAASAAPFAPAMSTWKCSCGRSNSINVGTCPLCGASKPR